MLAVSKRRAGLSIPATLDIYARCSCVANKAMLRWLPGNAIHVSQYAIVSPPAFGLCRVLFPHQLHFYAQLLL